VNVEIYYFIMTTWDMSFPRKGNNNVPPVPAEAMILTDSVNTSKTLSYIKELVIQSKSTNKIIGLQ